MLWSNLPQEAEEDCGPKTCPPREIHNPSLCQAPSAEGTSPSRSPGGVLLKNKREGLECPSEGRLPGRQPAYPGPDKPGPMARSKFKCDSHFHSPGQLCCQTSGFHSHTHYILPRPDKAPPAAAPRNPAIVKRLRFP